MKIRKISIVLFLLILFLTFSIGCENRDDGADFPDNKSEINKLEKLKEQKRKTADSLKQEIKDLRAKQDSLKKVIDDEQN